MADAVIKHSRPVNPSVLSDIKGWFAEEKVSMVLEEMMGDKIIKNWGKSDKFSFDDGLKKTDHFIYPWEGEPIKLQVESSYNYRTKEICERHHIYYLAVPYWMGLEETERMILKILRKEEEKRIKRKHRSR